MNGETYRVVQLDRAPDYLIEYKQRYRSMGIDDGSIARSNNEVVYISHFVEFLLGFRPLVEVISRSASLVHGRLRTLPFPLETKVDVQRVTHQYIVDTMNVTRKVNRDFRRGDLFGHIVVQVYQNA